MVLFNKRSDSEGESRRTFRPGTLCKICGTTLQGAWVDVRVGGVFRHVCESCAEKNVPLMESAAVL